MRGWTALDLLPGLYVALLAVGLAALLRRWYDPVPWRILAVFGLVLAILLGPVLFAGGVLLPLGSLPHFVPFRQLPSAHPPTLPLHGDLIHQITPWSFEVREALREGRWPLWNANAGAGMPLLADPQAQVFQPLVVAAYPFSLWPAVGITAALRVLVGLVFSFLLLRRQGVGETAALAGGLAFGLGGFVLLWLGWPMANCAVLLPPVLYGISRADDHGKAADFLLLFTATVALLLGGHPETLIYSASFAGLFLLDRVRRRAGRTARWKLLRQGVATMALAGAAVAPVLLPALDYLPKTGRAQAVAWALSPISAGEFGRELVQPETLELWRKRIVRRLLPIAAPRAFGDHNWYWGEGNVIDDADGFVGSAALLAALVALMPLRGRRRFPQERLVIAALIGGLLLIVQPPGLDRLLGQLPVIGATFIHKNHRLLLVVSLLLACLAAFEVERRQGPRWRIFAAAAVLAGVMIWGHLAYPHPENPGILADFRNRMLALHLVTLVLAAFLLAWRPKGRWGTAIPWLLCGLVAVELLWVHRPAVPPAPRRLAYPVTPPLRFLQERLGSFRMLGLSASVLPANFHLIYGLNDVRIDNPSIPAAYGEATVPIRPWPPMRLFARPGHPLYDLLGVRYVLTRPRAAIPFKLAFRHPAGWIYERPRPLPRLFLPTRTVVFHGRKPLLEWLERNPDFGRRALVQSSPGRERNWRARAGRESSLEFRLPEPAHLRARASLAEPRLLASSVYQDGHWHLLAGGERRPTVLANGPFLAAWLAAGEQRIDLVYRPGIFVAGCLLAALALALAAAWWVPRPVRRLLGYPVSA